MKKSEKILLVTAGFPYGEWERGFLSTEFSHLCESFDVSVLSVGTQEPLLYPFPEEIPVERLMYPEVERSVMGALRLLCCALKPEVFRELLRALRKQPFSGKLRRFKQITGYYLKAQYAAQTIERIHRERQIDLIYCYWCTEPAVGACLLKKRYSQLRVIARLHGHDLFVERKTTGWQPFRSMIVKNVDRLVFACRMGQEYFLSKWGGADKAALHYLGCSKAEPCQRTPAEDLRIVSCSNLIPLKRVDCIVEAIGLLPKTLRVQWDHFGDGVERASLEAQAEDCLGEHVTWKFHGHVPNGVLRDVYRELSPDVFLTASSTEGGVPVSMQEAFSMGIPAIGTAVGGIPELIISGENGFLLSPETTPQEVADTLMKFYHQPAEAKHRMSENALTLWKTQFDAERNAEEFVSLLRCILQN